MHAQPAALPHRHTWLTSAAAAHPTFPHQLTNAMPSYTLLYYVVVRHLLMVCSGYFITRLPWLLRTQHCYCYCFCCNAITFKCTVCRCAAHTGSACLPAAHSLSFCLTSLHRDWMRAHILYERPSQRQRRGASTQFRLNCQLTEWVNDDYAGDAATC